MLDHVRTARAKGLAGHRVVLRHVLRNAAIPIVTVIGLQLGLLLSGAVLTETIFSLPGVGRLMVDSILSRDYPVVQAGALFIAAMFVCVNLLVDLSYAVLDPRITPRMSGTAEVTVAAGRAGRRGGAGVPAHRRAHRPASSPSSS